MWYTKFPSMNGPATDHFFRSGEWKRNPPFFVPTATTTLPFLIERAMSTTGDAGEDVDDVSRIQFRFREGRSDEFLVHEDVHVWPAPARLVDDAIPDSREARFEGAQHRGDVRRLQDDFVLAVRVGTQRRRDPHEHTRSGDFLGRDIGDDSSPRTASTARRKAFGRRPRAGMRKALSRPSRSRGRWTPRTSWTPPSGSRSNPRFPPTRRSTCPPRTCAARCSASTSKRRISGWRRKRGTMS